MEQFLDRYTIEAKIGHGSVSTVHRALDTKLNRKVAIKILHPHLVLEGNWIKRFEEEAKTLAMISHPNVTHIYDFGLSDENYFIVLELIDGIDFNKLLKEHETIPWEAALILFYQIASGLNHVHKHSIIHRDIKLQNLLLQSNGIAKITDFSLAKPENGAELTGLDHVAGTPCYIAPEIIDGKRHDIKSDIFAFGVSFYYMLTGSPPFSGNTVPAIFDRIRKGSFVPLENKGISVPEVLAGIINKCFCADPSERFNNMEEIIKAFDGISISEKLPMDFSIIAQYLKSPCKFVSALRKQEIEDKLTEAVRLRDSGKMFDSINIFKQVLQMDPENDEALKCIEGFKSIDGSTETRLPKPGRLILTRKLYFTLTAAVLTIMAVLLLWLIGKRNNIIKDVVKVEHKNNLSSSLITDSTSKGQQKEIISVNLPTVNNKQKQIIPEINQTANKEKPISESIAKDTKEADVLPVFPSPLPCKGQITLFSTVWAYVFLDGEKNGIAPTKTPIVLPCGIHQLELRRPTGEIYRSQINITPDSSTHLKIEIGDYR